MAIKLSKEKLLKELQTKSISTIANEIGLSYCALQWYLSKYGISVRKLKKAKAVEFEKNVIELLKYKTIKDIAIGLNVTYDSLACRLKSLGISARDIKKERSLELAVLYENFPGKQFQEETGFSKSKVNKIRKMA